MVLRLAVCDNIICMKSHSNSLFYHLSSATKCNPSSGKGTQTCAHLAYSTPSPGSMSGHRMCRTGGGAAVPNQSRAPQYVIVCFSQGRHRRLYLAPFSAATWDCVKTGITRHVTQLLGRPTSIFPGNLLPANVAVLCDPILG